jgi:hypothetical protein
MMNIIELAKQAGLKRHQEQAPGIDGLVGKWADLEAFAELVRADERGRMCKQCKECLNEKSTSNEANRPAFLGEGGQAN